MNVYKNLKHQNVFNIQIHSYLDFSLKPYYRKIAKKKFDITVK